MSAIALSRRQVKDADRIGGIELMLRWPAELGVAPVMLQEDVRDATAAEHQAATKMVRRACEAAALVPVRTRVRCVLGPHQEAPRVYLAVTIIGARWVHASTGKRPRRAFVEGLE